MLSQQIRQDQSIFPRLFNIIFNYIDELQFLENRDNLFLNKHALKSTELIRIRTELVFCNFNTGPVLKLIVTCLNVKKDHMNSGFISLRELKTSITRMNELSFMN